MEEHMKVIYTCFPKGKHKVLTMSYDDGRKEDRRLVAMFNEYGIKGTFNLNGGLDLDERIPKQEYKKLYEGHEVACHTYLHPTIARSPIEHVAREILEDRRTLEKVMGYPVRGLAYPNGSVNRQIMDLLPATGIRYARTTVSTDGFAMPEDFYHWDATCHHDRNLLERGQEFAALYKKQYLYMMYVWGHSYEFTQNGNWDVMENFCKMIGHRQDIWYASNIQIVDYMRAAAELEIGVDGDFVYNPNAQSIWLEVDGRIMEAEPGKLVAL
ncbi:MAG: polysaccharide deacetylase family protein [Butyrivibrio sp.]|jgi:hypothetical protein|nr:polysaccharide deacetylase family protein [Butyrivibrio sp.]